MRQMTPKILILLSILFLIQAYKTDEDRNAQLLLGMQMQIQMA